MNDTNTPRNEYINSEKNIEILDSSFLGDVNEVNLE